MGLEGEKDLLLGLVWVFTPCLSGQEEACLLNSLRCFSGEEEPSLPACLLAFLVTFSGWAVRAGTLAAGCVSSCSGLLKGRSLPWMPEMGEGSSEDGWMTFLPEQSKQI